MFLQLLGRGFADIPRLTPTSVITLPPGQATPIIVLTSNNMRSGVSGPLRSRCLFTYVHPPGPAEEVTILKTQVPQVTDALLAQVVKILAYIRRMPNIAHGNKPGLRESIALLRALTRSGVEVLDELTIKHFLTYLGKQESDRNSLVSAVAALARAAHEPDVVLAQAIRLGLANYQARQKGQAAAKGA